MPAAKIELGGMLSVPAKFEPTEQFADRFYLYRIDRVRGICKLTILNDQATRPAGYYAVAKPAVRPADPNPEQTQLVPETLAPPKPVRPPRQLPKITLPKLRLPQLTLPKIKLPRRQAPKQTRFTRQSKPGVRRPIVAVASMVATAAAFLIVYPLYPQIQYNVSQTIGSVQSANNALAQSPVATANELRIPKIGVRTPVLESDSLDILNKKEGVWHQSGTLNADNFVLAGHRWKYLPPNTSTFYNLNKLVAGDTIVIDWFQRRYIYTVKQVLTVSQDRTDLIQPTAEPRVTLYTCNDKKESERIVVIADLEQ
jgi:LPXTG-site transpeptidase (sortase) family protein